MAKTVDIKRSELDQIKLANIKAHILGEILDANVTKGAWTNFGSLTYPFTIVEAETYGDLFKLSPDKSTFSISKPALIHMGGCVHFQNNTGGATTPSLAVRVYSNANHESRCTQSYWSGDFKTGGEQYVRYAGTHSVVKPNEYLNLQYYVVAGSGLDFKSNSTFDSSVVCTVTLFVLGLPPYNAKKEKIIWNIID